jgi:ABC transporter substrate binding protein
LVQQNLRLLEVRQIKALAERVVDRRQPIAALAARGRLLSIGPEDIARAGGTMSYGIDFVATYRHAAAFVDGILKGANPADLSIERASKFQVVLNLKTAKALGLEVPPGVSAQADDIIE